MFLYLAHLAVHKGNEEQLFRAPDEEIAKFSYILDPERRIQAGEWIVKNHMLKKNISYFKRNKNKQFPK